MSKLILLFSMVLVMCLLEENHAWWLKKKGRGGVGGSYPFYFGKTNLLCMGKFRRGPPSRWNYSPSHRWIKYRNYYFEWGISENGGSKSGKVAKYGTRPTLSNKCGTSRESRPAGYSNLPLSCVIKCTRTYKSRYGSYSLFGNNCHKFANRLASIFHYNRSCPSWCR